MILGGIKEEIATSSWACDRLTPPGSAKLTRKFVEGAGHKGPTTGARPRKTMPRPKARGNQGPPLPSGAQATTATRARQARHDARVPVRRTDVRGCGAVLVRGVHVRARIQQRLHDSGVAVAAGLDERGVAVEVRVVDGEPRRAQRGELAAQRVVGAAAIEALGNSLMHHLALQRIVVTAHVIHGPNTQPKCLFHRQCALQR